MTLHAVALPHTRVTPEFCGCAYTAKTLKFTKMMRDRFNVILYAPEGSTSEFTLETVDVLSDAERTETFGVDDPDRLPSWPSYDQTEAFNVSAARAIRQRYEPGDLILLTAGSTHSLIQREFPEGLYCEPGVGYEGITTPFCAFESHAWRHYVYAKQGIADGRWFDRVIPNYFDLDEFPTPAPYGGGDYLLFFGRVVPRKGPHVALEIAQQYGLPLVVAGAGVSFATEGRIEAGMGTPDQVVLEGDVLYAGTVNVEERAELLAGARALLAPTLYLEPFGGVAVEAMLCGTPAITSDWGAFTETVQEGVTGFRFATLQEGVTAVERAGDLSPNVVRARTAARYSLDAVGPQFQRWFGNLGSLYGAGWYQMDERVLTGTREPVTMGE